MSDLRQAAQAVLEAMLNFPDDISDKMFELITALKAALAEPVEPVAWLVTDCIGERDLIFSPPLDNDQVLPLYAAPPQRKPLTEEEIDKIADHLDATVIGWSTHEFTRAIERAHKIGVV